MIPTIVRGALLGHERQWLMTANTGFFTEIIFRKEKQWKICGGASVTYQVDCVKHLDFSYCSAAWVGQITIVIADGQGTQPCEQKHQRNERKMDYYDITELFLLCG